MRVIICSLFATALLASCVEPHQEKHDADPTALEGGTGDAIDIGVGELGPHQNGPDADSGPYKRTITIDGVNDFDPGREAIVTTSNGFTAYVSWDDETLYFGYAGSDLQTCATGNMGNSLV